MKIRKEDYPKDTHKAIGELNRMAVLRYVCEDIVKESVPVNFADLYCAVQHEHDLSIALCKEGYTWSEIKAERHLPYHNIVGTLHWLNRWAKLYDKYEYK